MDTDDAARVDASPAREKRKRADATDDDVDANARATKHPRLPDAELLRLFCVLWDQLPEPEKICHRAAMGRVLRASLDNEINDG